MSPCDKLLIRRINPFLGHREIPFPFRKCPRAMNLTPNRHGEARRAVAIQKFGAKELDRFAALAMTNQ
jgi:hypothetical protein